MWCTSGKAGNAADSNRSVPHGTESEAAGTNNTTTAMPGSQRGKSAVQSTPNTSDPSSTQASVERANRARAVVTPLPNTPASIMRSNTPRADAARTTARPSPSRGQQNQRSARGGGTGGTTATSAQPAARGSRSGSTFSAWFQQVTKSERHYLKKAMRYPVQLPPRIDQLLPPVVLRSPQSPSEMDGMSDWQPGQNDVLSFGSSAAEGPAQPRQVPAVLSVSADGGETGGMGQGSNDLFSDEEAPPAVHGPHAFRGTHSRHASLTCPHTAAAAAVPSPDMLSSPIGAIAESLPLTPPDVLRPSSPQLHHAPARNTATREHLPVPVRMKPSPPPQPRGECLNLYMTTRERRAFRNRQLEQMQSQMRHPDAPLPVQIDESDEEMCTTGVNLRVFIDGVVSVKARQLRTKSEEPPIGEVVNESVNSAPTQPHQQPDKPQPRYYHAHPLTYIQLSEHPLLWTKEERRARRAVTLFRSDSEVEYGEAFEYLPSTLAQPAALQMFAEGNEAMVAATSDAVAVREDAGNAKACEDIHHRHTPYTVLLSDGDEANEDRYATATTTTTAADRQEDHSPFVGGGVDGLQQHGVGGRSPTSPGSSLSIGEEEGALFSQSSDFLFSTATHSAPSPSLPVKLHLKKRSSLPCSAIPSSAMQQMTVSSHAHGSSAASDAVAHTAAAAMRTDEEANTNRTPFQPTFAG